MDRKSIVILLACFVLVMSWTSLMRKVYPPTPIPTNLVTNATSPLATTSTNQTAVPSLNSVPGTVLTRPESKFVVQTNIAESLVVISNELARYTFTSHGGGLKEVKLLRYPETVSSHRLKTQQANDLATLNAPNVPPVFAILGDAALQGDGIFNLTPISGGVRAEKTFASGLKLVKDFQLGANYEMTAAVRFENDSKAPLTLPPQVCAAGTATPMGPQDNALAEMVYWYNGSKSSSVTVGYFNTNTSSFFGLFARTPLTEYLGTNNVTWVSAQNQFFTLVTMPQPPAAAVVVHMVNLPPPGEEEVRENHATVLNPMGLQTGLIYPGFTLQPGQTVTNQFTLFAGPKEYQTLAALAAHYNNDVDLIMSFGWAGAVSKALLVTMNWLHSGLNLGYGWVIILITVVIKSVFWPLTRASTRSAKRMQELQPQLKALQDKYKDDPQKLTSKQWEFYKKNKVNPLSGCLPMLLQVPVFIGFYGMLRSAIELRGAPFLWIGDLSKPDTMLSIPLPLHLLGFHDAYFPVNPMPLIMGATLLWQTSMTPMSPSMDASQQKMMKYMPLMMLLFMYNLSSGLALYWTVSNLLTVLQTKLTKTQPATAGVAMEPVKAAVLAPQKKKK